MIRTALLLTLGCALTVVGLVGLVVPLLPGVVFLAAAALCFGAVSPGFRSRLARHPAWGTCHRRWQASRGMPLLQRARLGFWLAADATLSTLRTR